MPFATVTSDYTITSADYVIFCNAAGKVLGVTITFPAAASNAGRIFRVKRINVFNGAQDRCLITPVGTTTGTTTVTLDAPDATATNINSALTLMSDGTKWWVIAAGP